MLLLLLLLLLEGFTWFPDRTATKANGTRVGTRPADSEQIDFKKLN